MSSHLLTPSLAPSLAPSLPFSTPALSRPSPSPHPLLVQASDQCRHMPTSLKHPHCHPTSLLTTDHPGRCVNTYSASLPLSPLNSDNINPLLPPLSLCHTANLSTTSPSSCCH
ncbi:hypothetical protein BDQ17DRAFT_1420813 [Cyathus striatus]|nr:hypothetical protein BDQ17DRAFT_1420813 [Cyathus striatus]